MAASAVATCRVVPSGVAADLATLAADIALETDIDTATVVPSASQVSVLRRHILVVTDTIAESGGGADDAEAEADAAIAAALTATGAELMGGQTTTYA